MRRRGLSLLPRGKNPGTGITLKMLRSISSLLPEQKNGALQKIKIALYCKQIEKTFVLER
jgi:hypothetical protein